MARKGTKAEREAGLVMETNSSSIVSKRSVERLYYPEPHFFRHFVKKPQRRSPLINRGYWLRMHAVERSIRKFLERPSDVQKVSVDIGANLMILNHLSSDPLPFQFLSRDPALCSNVKFIDIDHHKLMIKKRDVINQCHALNNSLSDIELPLETGNVLLRSKQYVGIGCDLGDLQKLETSLKAELGLEEVSILCTAEVSLTYMEVNLADAVIQWASKLSSDVNFCLLEQYFPDGPNNPFASTMMKHFLKLQSPLHSIHKYPTLHQQEQRFRDFGWATAKATNLWELWSEPSFLSSEQRQSLDSVEAFDEWEEFALFASHYFLLSATTRRTDSETSPVHQNKELGIEPSPLGLVPLCPPKFKGQRRFGAIVPTTCKTLGLHGGLGQQTRLSSTDEYAASSVTSTAAGEMPPLTMEGRMCHTITQLTKEACLLVGGRTSPSKALGDCWSRSSGTWRRTDNLPRPLYRHCATMVDFGNGNPHVLVYGGKTNTGEVSDLWLLWHELKGWQPVQVTDESITPRFGASIVNVDGQSGVLFGGMTQDGVVLDDFWAWKLAVSDDGSPKLEVNNLTENMRASMPLYKLLGRFGATVNSTTYGIVVIGGILKHNCIPHDYEILLLNPNALRCLSLDPNVSALATIEPGLGLNGPRPLLVGHSSHTINSDSVLILGGGAICFSFGIYWNEGTWLLQSVESDASNEWTLFEPPKEHVQNPSDELARTKDGREKAGTPDIQTIPRVAISTAREFQIIVDNAKPVILSDLDIGSCQTLWTKEYLENAIGRDRKVVVHEAQGENMNFQTKNFSYVTKDFGAFMDEIHTGSRQYLRSISSTNPTERPANFAQDFPSLQHDFQLPSELSLVSENAHSSPLRISGPVVLWLHYDVLANVLCQIQGEKRLILYPPSDVTRLGFSPGASSSSVNLFQNLADSTPLSPPNTHPHQALLKPGDILFLPPLWLHTANPTDGTSVAVNVFFRNLDKGYAVGRDVYGNRDLHAYEKGRQDVEKLIRSFDGLPHDMTRFYLERLADELKRKART
ncbi:hypothetical protein FQN50_005828 [Emmonsiellopsis sp. PD_5]|nr:hypothetical protein FQN50_005828 [Emmonsiellopsis sp. PD_5]